jgi:hypothetical protein
MQQLTPDLTFARRKEITMANIGFLGDGVLG